MVTPIRGCTGHENFLICEGNHWLHPLQKLQLTLPNGEAHWGFALELSLPSIEGTLHRWGSAVATLASSLGCHTMCLEVAWTCISPGTSGAESSLPTPITWLCAFGTSNDAHTFCLKSQWLSWSGTSCSSHHQTSMSTCWMHHCIHSAFCMGGGSGLSSLKFMASRPLLLWWPEKSPAHSRAPEGGAPVVVDTLIPLLPPPLTS